MSTTFTYPNVRFQWLTPQFVRLEWSEDGVFEDRKTLAVSNREMPKVTCTVKETSKGVAISSSDLTLKYRGGGDAFSKENLSITFKIDGKRATWTPGMEPIGNLGGTARTLDGVNGRMKAERVKNPIYKEGALGDQGKKYLRVSKELDLGTGLISTDGWALIDDSKNMVFTDDWIAPRTEGERHDWYFLGYGLDFTTALTDASKVFGSQPLPPRYAFGYWWSRYWAYSDHEIETLLDSCDTMNIPIDVMVIDMDWHLEGWTGYTWDKRYFPDPDELLSNMRSRGIKTTLNLHPADGVGKHEEQFEDMAEAMGLNSKKVDKVPFDITNPTYMKNYFEILHHPEERRGIDFWWMDWQQGETTAMKGLDTLPWINHLHWQDMAQNEDRGNKRPLIFSRYGGIGSGRYCIGFSGDTFSNWDSLQYQPYFTSTASNVLYGYWSHDIGGHQPGAIEPELYLRWMQFGVYSPILRTHTTKNSDAERRVWEYPAPYNTLMMDLIRKRYEMVPYVYTECKKTHETAISLCRPMYYNWPKEDRAYDSPDQYMFGDEMLVSPVLIEADESSQLAEVSTWLPKGKWFNVALGQMENGGQTVTHAYSFGDVPIFVRPGTIIPGQRQVNRLTDTTIRDLTVTVYPGKSGEYLLYEDDGQSSDYESDTCVTTAISHSMTGKKQTISVAKPKGNYKGYSAVKNLEIRLPGTVPPRSVGDLKYAFRLGNEGWTYDGDGATTIIRIPKVNLKRGFELTVEHGIDSRADRLKGLMIKLSALYGYCNQLTSMRDLHPLERLVVDLAQTGNRVSRKPETFAAELKRLRKNLPDVGEALSIFREKQGKRKPALCDHAEAIYTSIQSEID